MNQLYSTLIMFWNMPKVNNVQNNLLHYSLNVFVESIDEYFFENQKNSAFASNDQKITFKYTMLLFQINL